MGNGFGKWAGDAAAAKGWSGNELARRAGISSSSVSRAINGKVMPERGTIEAICEALGRDVGEAYAALVGEDYILIRRELAGQELAGQIRVTLRSKLLQPGVRSLLRAVMDQIEEGKG